MQNLKLSIHCCIILSKTVNNKNKSEREVLKMSPKELQYVDDALSHEQFLKCQCETTAQKLSSAELKNFVSLLATQHQEIFGKLFSTL